MADRLSALDAAYLNQDSSANRMNIAGLAVLDPATRPGGLSFADVARVVEGRLHLLPRLRQRVLPVPGDVGRPVWVDDPAFSLSRHLRHVVLPPPGDDRALEECVEQVHARPLDRTRPLWELYVIEGLDGGRVGTLMRFHHALADGMSAVHAATTLLGDAGAPQPWHPAPPPTSGQLIRDALEEQLTRPLEGLGALARALIDEPRRVLDRAAELRQAVASLPGPDTFTPGPFNRAVGPYRRFSTAQVPVADLRPVRKALGASVLEVVLALVAGALGHLLAARGLDIHGRSLRALVPTSELAAPQRTAFGNEGSWVIIDLPVGPIEEGRRVARIRAALTRVRRSRQDLVASALRSLWEYLPPAADALLTRTAPPDSVDLVVSYMRGTRQALSLDGARHLVTYPVPPLAPRLALTIAVVQLGGALGFGFVGDWDAVPDLATLPAGIRLTLEAQRESGYRAATPSP